MNTTARTFLAAATFFAAGIVQSQAGDATGAFIDRVATHISDFEAKNREIKAVKIGVLGRDRKMDIGVELEKDVKYYAVVFGDGEALVDVDVIITGEDGRVTSKCDTDANMIELEMTRNFSEVATFSIIAAGVHKKFEAGMYAFVLARACDPGELVPAASLCKQLPAWTGKSSEEFLRSCSINRVGRDGATTTLSFYPEFRYTFVAIGDGESILDLDFRILDKKGGVVALEDSDANTGVVKFSPTAEGDHKIQWAPNKMKKGASYGHIAYIVFFKPKAENKPSTASTN